PPDLQVLAANEVSAIQAVVVQTPKRGSFHGTQYHPEHTLAVSAALMQMRAAELVEEGFATEPTKIVAIAEDYGAMDAEPTRRDAIRMPLANDRFRLVRVDDHADRLHRNTAGLFDGGSERHLVPGRDGRPCRRTDAAGGDTDVIEANVAQLSGKYARLIRRDPAVNPVSASNAHTERLPARPDLAERGRHFQRIAHAIGEAATIPIRSPVCDRREKAVQQKAMRTQQFDQ